MTGSEPLPFVSVIMPIRNEAKYIERSLGAVLSQDYPHSQMEVLISDGMSTDSTRDLIRTLAGKSDIPVKIVDNPKQIVPTGFNLALKQAKGEIIVRVDGHCEVAPNYVSASVACLQTNDVAGVGGPIETIGPDNLSAIIAAAMSSPFGVGGSAFRVTKDSTMLVDTIAFPAYKREAMNAAGYLDEELPCNEDDEYNYRLRALGYKLLLCAETHSKYFSRSSLTSLWRQYFRYGYYKVLVLQKHPFQMRPRQFAPFMLVVTLLLTALLAIIVPPTGFLFVGLLGLYVIANLAASIITALHTNPAYIWILPVVFAILHFSYGVGFALGLITFYKGWNTRKALT